MCAYACVGGGGSASVVRVCIVCPFLSLCLMRVDIVMVHISVIIVPTCIYVYISSTRVFGYVLYIVCIYIVKYYVRIYTYMLYIRYV